MYESLVAFGGYCNALNMLEDKNAVDGLFNEMINSWTLKKGTGKNLIFNQKKEEERKKNNNKADDKKKKDKKKSKKSSFGKDTQKTYYWFYPFGKHKGKKDWLINYFLNI